MPLCWLSRSRRRSHVKQLANKTGLLVMPPPHSPKQNYLIAALPTAEFESLVMHLKLVWLQLGDILYEPGEILRYAYFPTTAIASLHYVMESGDSAETAGVGNEGMVGIALIMGGNATSSSAMVRTAGHAYRLESNFLKQAFDRVGPLQSLLLRYLQALTTQFHQTAACNRHHSMKQQLCRWLLLNLDRSPFNEFMMTLELIAGILGVDRRDLIQAAESLHQAGYIKLRREHITVLVRAGLEICACECYAAEKREFTRLLPVVLSD